jgi:hypothetical protein
MKKALFLAIMRYCLFIILVLFSSFKPKPISENELYCYIKEIGILHPEVVLKQAIYETGHFKSNIYKKKNNVFGFRRTSKYIYYKNWQACVDYYKVWQDKHYKDTTQNYYTFLQKINYSGHKGFNYAFELKGVKIKDSLICNRDFTLPSKPFVTF